MAQSARIITEEEDDREDAPAAPQQVGIPPDADIGILGTGANVPGSRQAVGRQEEEPFEIVEVNSEDEGLPSAVAPPAQSAPVADQPTVIDDQTQQDPNQPRFGKKWSERQRRREGRERTLAENRALKAEVDQLRQQITGVTREFQTVAPRLAEITEAQARGQLSQVEQQIADTSRTYEQAEDGFFRAQEAGDWANARVFLRQRDEALIRRTQLQGHKAQIEREATARKTAPRTDPNLASQPDNGGYQPRLEDGTQQRTQPRQPAPLPPEAVELAQEFMRDIPWLNKPGAEDDSEMMQILDSRVARMGLDPSNNEYWDELMDQARTYIPHRFQPEAQPVRQQRQPPARQAAPAAQQPAPIRRGPPTGAPGNAGNGQRPNQVRITPERRTALEEAGIVDGSGKVVDRKKFDRIAASYAEIDRANGVGR